MSNYIEPDDFEIDNLRTAYACNPTEANKQAIAAAYRRTGNMEALEHGTLKRAAFADDLSYNLYLAERAAQGQAKPSDSPYAKALMQLLDTQEVTRMTHEPLEAWAFRALSYALAAHPPASPSAPERSGKLEDDWPSLDDVAPLIKAQLGYVPGTPAPAADSSSAAPSDEAKCWQLAYAIRDWYRSQWPEHGGIQENDPPFSKFLAAPAPTVAAPSEDGTTIRWVDADTKQIFGKPTATDALEYANTRLIDNEEMACSKTDHRLLKMDNLRALFAAPTGASQSAEQPINSVALNLDAQLRSVIKERDGLRAALAQTQANSDDISAHLGAMTKTATTLRAAAMPAQAGVVPEEIQLQTHLKCDGWVEVNELQYAAYVKAGRPVRHLYCYLTPPAPTPRTLTDADIYEAYAELKLPHVPVMWTAVLGTVRAIEQHLTAVPAKGAI